MKTIPTIAELSKRISDDLKSNLNISDSELKGVLNAFSLVIAGQMKLLYMFLADVQDNVFPDKATTSEFGGTLERLGDIYLNRSIFPATIGRFKVSVTGVANSVLRADLTFASNEDSLNPAQVYVLNNQFILTGTNDIIQIESTGNGLDFKLNVGDKLTITEPVVGVESQVTVTEILLQPLASETIEEYREAILNAIQLEPQGGADADYRIWANDAQGVRKIYPYLKDGSAGTVQIYVEATIVDSADSKGTPSTPVLNEVRDVINTDPDETKPENDRRRKPMQATIEVLPITIFDVDVIVIGLQDNSTPVYNSIRKAIDDLLYQIRPYVAGADLLRNKNSILNKGVVQSTIIKALTNGNFFTDIDVRVQGNSVNIYEFSLGNIPYLRNLSV